MSLYLSKYKNNLNSLFQIRTWTSVIYRNLSFGLQLFISEILRHRNKHIFKREVVDILKFFL